MAWGRVRNMVRAAVAMALMSAPEMSMSMVRSPPIWFWNRPAWKLKPETPGMELDQPIMGPMSSLARWSLLLTTP